MASRLIFPLAMTLLVSCSSTQTKSEIPQPESQPLCKHEAAGNPSQFDKGLVNTPIQIELCAAEESAWQRGGYLQVQGSGHRQLDFSRNVTEACRRAQGPDDIRDCEIVAVDEER